MTATTDNQTIEAAAAALGAVEPQAPAKAIVVTAPADSRLEQLAAQYDLAKAEKDKAEEALKAITDAIKLELTNAAPGATSVDLHSDQLTRPLRLQAISSWRINTEKLKSEQPLIYASYAKPSVAWQLRRVG